MISFIVYRAIYQCCNQLRLYLCIIHRKMEAQKAALDLYSRFYELYRKGSVFLNASLILDK